jgi:hypothetical protein
MWLSAFSAVWLLMEPSIFQRERPHEARIRVFGAIFTDPVFWASLLLTVICAVRCFNSGVGMEYDAENGNWYMAKAAMEFLPGTVEGAAYLPLTAVMALTVALQACRHSLGKGARTAYLMVSSGFAGVAAVVLIVAAYYGHPGAVKLMQTSLNNPSYAGVAFAVHLLSGIAAMVGAFERKWNAVIFLALFSLGGSAAGLFAFAPAYVCAVFAVAVLLMTVYAFCYMGHTMRKAAEFKYLVVLGLSLTLGTLLVLAAVDGDIVSSRTAPFLSGEFLSDELMKPRSVLSEIAFKSWKDHLWIGTGVGSFPVDISFNATGEDWAVIGNDRLQALNGWWQLLAERGILGAVFFAVMLGFLFFTYIRRAIGAFKAWQWPHPVCFAAPLAVAAVAAAAFFDGSFMRADVIIAVGALLAVAAGAFPKEKSDGR